jgi:predicted component of viral defense system (DUF524 family)
MTEVRSEAEIEFHDSEQRYVATARIYSPSDDGENSGSTSDESIVDSRSLIVLDEGEHEDVNEERVQLLEDRSYEYEIVNAIGEEIRLRESSVVSRSRISSSRDCGRIEVGGRVGVLQLTVEDESGRRVGTAAVEARSRKMGYREDFREMISDIADRSCDLLMRVRTPNAGRFRPDPGADAGTIAQQFAFVRSLFTSQGLRRAITRILRNPHVETITEREEKSVRRGLKSDSQTGAQLARGQPRIPVPDGHPLKEKLNSLPEKVRSTKQKDTVDTEENRFVKYVLRSFGRFLDDLSRVIEDNAEVGESPADERLLKEVRELNQEVGDILERDFFRELSTPSSLPLGSSVLQRKAGYRKVLQTWLQFGAAARLGWEGGEDVYRGGQRDIDTLYEYWIFFYLFDSVCEEFELSSVPADDLFEETRDKFGLKLKAGKELSVKGTCHIGRPLSVEFSYNKTFQGGADYNELGSWTRGMRPDYTLSLWPAELEKREAGRLELLTHVHFDAKYRLGRLEEIISDETEDSNFEDESRNEGRRKARTSDLQRAHAYRDAIRQTEGTFVLYPGDKSEARRLYREILPGVGALAVTPTGEGEEILPRLLRGVAEHTSDRATRREQDRYYSQLVHSAESPYQVREEIPETDPEGNRSLPPVEHKVLVYLDPPHQLDEWIRRRGYVAVPVRHRLGDVGLLHSRHVLLWDSESGQPLSVYRRFPPRSMQIRTEFELSHRGYPGPLEPQAQHVVLRVLQISERWPEKVTSWSQDIGGSDIEVLTLAEMIGESREAS